MKRGFKAKVTLTILVCLLVSNIPVLAKEKGFVDIPQNPIVVVPDENSNTIEAKANPSLSGCTLEIGIASNGLQLSFRTRATQTADEIGVKNVVLQEKVWYGWKNITLNIRYVRNSDLYSGSVVYTEAKAGTTYRVNCTHYAIFDGTELTLYSESKELKYN